MAGREAPEKSWRSHERSECESRDLNPRTGLGKAGGYRYLTLARCCAMGAVAADSGAVFERNGRRRLFQVRCLRSMQLQSPVDAAHRLAPGREFLASLGILAPQPARLFITSQHWIHSSLGQADHRLLLYGPAALERT